MSESIKIKKQKQKQKSRTLPEWSWVGQRKKNEDG